MSVRIPRSDCDGTRRYSCYGAEYGGDNFSEIKIPDPMRALMVIESDCSANNIYMRLDVPKEKTLEELI